MSQRIDTGALDRLTDGDYADMVHRIADGLRYDPDLNRIVVDTDFDLGPDPSFPDDDALHSGRLTAAIWVMALRSVADDLPPWEHP